MTTFNANQFLETNVTAKFDTSFPSVPSGEYRGVIDGLKVRTGQGDDKDGTVLDVLWEVLDEGVQAITGLKKVIVRQGIWLDIENGQLAYGTGKNVSLGRLREELGQNDESRSWSPNMLRGAVAKIVIEQKPNEKDPNSPYSNVTKVVRIE